MARKSPVALNFNRLPLGTTFARQIAKGNLTDLNDAYWVTEHSHALVKSSFSDIRMPTDPNAHGIYGSDKQWRGAVDIQREWLRRHVTFSAASLLEVYVVSAATISFWSRPELIDRSLIAIKRGTFAKHLDQVPKHFKNLVQESTKKMSKGRWKERFIGMSSIFGVIPPPLLALEPKLQLLQDRRNRIAHSFGADGELPKTPWQPTRTVVASPTYINDVLTLVGTFIRLADEHIFGPNIGGYEMLHEFHSWTGKQKRLTHMKVTGTLERTFRKYVGEAFGGGPGKDYFTSMIKYYDSL